LGHHTDAKDGGYTHGGIVNAKCETNNGSNILSNMQQAFFPKKRRIVEGDGEILQPLMCGESQKKGRSIFDRVSCELISRNGNEKDCSEIKDKPENSNKKIERSWSEIQKGTELTQQWLRLHGRY